MWSRKVTFAIKFNTAGSSFGVDDPVALGAAGAVLHFESINTTELLNQVVLVIRHGHFECFEKDVSLEVIRVGGGRNSIEPNSRPKNKRQDSNNNSNTLVSNIDEMKGQNVSHLA